MKKIISSILFVFILTLSYSQDSNKPNVLLLYMDDLRPELNSYGATHINSPNIDKRNNEPEVIL